MWPARHGRDILAHSWAADFSTSRGTPKPVDPSPANPTSQPQPLAYDPPHSSSHANAELLQTLGLEASRLGSAHQAHEASKDLADSDYPWQGGEVCDVLERLMGPGAAGLPEWRQSFKAPSGLGRRALIIPALPIQSRDAGLQPEAIEPETCQKASLSPPRRSSEEDFRLPVRNGIGAGVKCPALPVQKWEPVKQGVEEGVKQPDLPVQRREGQLFPGRESAGLTCMHSSHGLLPHCSDRRVLEGGIQARASRAGSKFGGKSGAHPDKDGRWQQQDSLADAGPEHARVSATEGEWRPALEPIELARLSTRRSGQDGLSTRNTPLAPTVVQQVRSGPEQGPSALQRSDRPHFLGSRTEAEAFNQGGTRRHHGRCTWPPYNALHALCKKYRLAKTLQDALLQAAIAQPRILEVDDGAVQLLGSLQWEAGIASVYQLAAEDFAGIDWVSHHFIGIMRAARRHA